MVKLQCVRSFACAFFAGCALRLTATCQLVGFAGAPDMLPRQAPLNKRKEEPRARLGRADRSSREAVNNHEVSPASYEQGASLSGTSDYCVYDYVCLKPCFFAALRLRALAPAKDLEAIPSATRLVGCRNTGWLGWQLRYRLQITINGEVPYWLTGS